jgi:hypothetical protein
VHLDGKSNLPDNEINIFCKAIHEVLEAVSTLHVVSVRSSETSENIYQPTVLAIVLQSDGIRTALKEGNVECRQFHIVSSMSAML